MSVLIHGLPMPISCELCPFCAHYEDDNIKCIVSQTLRNWSLDLVLQRHRDCPLIEVPDSPEVIE